jgi:hypothetical protein
MCGAPYLLAATGFEPLDFDESPDDFSLFGLPSEEELEPSPEEPLFDEESFDEESFDEESFEEESFEEEFSAAAAAVSRWRFRVP